MAEEAKSGAGSAEPKLALVVVTARAAGARTRQAGTNPGRPRRVDHRRTARARGTRNHAQANRPQQAALTQSRLHSRLAPFSRASVLSSDREIIELCRSVGVPGADG